MSPPLADWATRMRWRFRHVVGRTSNVLMPVTRSRAHGALHATPTPAVAASSVAWWLSATAGRVSRGGAPARRRSAASVGRQRSGALGARAPAAGAGGSDTAAPGGDRGVGGGSRRLAATGPGGGRTRRGGRQSWRTRDGPSSRHATSRGAGRGRRVLGRPLAGADQRVDQGRLVPLAGADQGRHGLEASCLHRIGVSAAGVVAWNRPSMRSSAATSSAAASRSPGGIDARGW